MVGSYLVSWLISDLHTRWVIKLHTLWFSIRYDSRPSQNDEGVNCFLYSYLLVFLFICLLSLLSYLLSLVTCLPSTTNRFNVVPGPALYNAGLVGYPINKVAFSFLQKTIVATSLLPLIGAMWYLGDNKFAESNGSLL